MSINLTQNYTFKKIEKQKEIKSINASYDQLCKQHSKLDKKLQEVFKDLKDIKSKSDSQERELMKKQKTIESLIEEKCELSSLVQDHKNYIRKLEAKVAIGAKGSSDISFTKQFQIQTQKKNALETELNEAFHKIQELEDHISVISRALEVKAQEMGNLNPVTLLNIGQNKEIMNKFRDKERELEIQTEELKIALDQSYETIEKLTQANEKSLTEALNLQNKLIQSENEKKKYQEVSFT
jgi:chromosome segregation ATPase